jgi:hypothetical protein
MRLFKFLSFGLAIGFLLCLPLRADLTNGLVAYYPFNGDASDASGNGHDGTIFNAVATADRFGQPLGALAFNGTNAYIDVPDSSPLNLSATDFTIAAWIFETQRNTNFNDCIASKRAKASDSGWFLSVRGDSDPQHTGCIFYSVSSGADPRMYSANVVPLNQWHHVAVVYTFASASMSMFIDGKLDSATNGLPAPNPTNSNHMQLGKDSAAAFEDAYFFQGNLDDLRIYDRALAASEIFELYQPQLFFINEQSSPTAFTATLGGTWNGLTTILQSSTDLITWNSIQTNVAGGPTQSITNLINPVINAQFFRAYSP